MWSRLGSLTLYIGFAHSLLHITEHVRDFLAIQERTGFDARKVGRDE
jgi:hypothetical protein